MKLAAIAITFTTLLATSSAAPTSNQGAVSAAASGPLTTSVKRANSCGASTFAVDTSSQAVVSHCQTILTVLQTSTFPSYNWPLDGNWKSMIAYDTCSFTARTTRNGRGQIGNEDVSDLLRDSVRDANRGGQVGARGVMSCGGVEVEWRVARATGNEGGTFIPGIGK